MTIYWHEHPDSRDGSIQSSDGQRRFVHVCSGTSSDGDVYSAALSLLSSVDSFGFLLTDIQVQPNTSGASEDDWSWLVESTYSHPESEEAKDASGEREKIDTVRYDFDVSTTSGHISHAIHQTEFPGNLADDAGTLKRAIEATYEGDVRGIDIPVPSLTLSVSKVWPRAQWRGTAGIANAKTLARCAGKTNKFAWWGFAQGELRFMSARPEEIGVIATKVTYTFEASENRANIDMGEMGNGAGVVVPLKRGHEYLGVYHKRQPVPNPVGGGEVMVPKPWIVYVSQVSEEVDYSIFGLPNAPP